MNFVALTYGMKELLAENFAFAQNALANTKSEMTQAAELNHCFQV